MKALLEAIHADRAEARTLAAVLDAENRYEWFRRQVKRDITTVDGLTWTSDPPTVETLQKAVSALDGDHAAALQADTGELLLQLARALGDSGEPFEMPEHFRQDEEGRVYVHVSVNLATQQPAEDGSYYSPTLAVADLDRLFTLGGQAAAIAFAVKAGGTIPIAAVVELWRHCELAKRPKRSPVGPLVVAWQEGPPSLDRATVTTTVSDDPGRGMTRRPALVSTLRRVHWRDDGPDPLVNGAVVDGKPMAAWRADTVDLFPVRKRRPRRRFKPGEQRTLPIPVVPAIPHDLRLVALADLAGDPALQGDVLALLAFAWVADRPLILTAAEGAALLARDRHGMPRRPVLTDIPRFWEAAYELRALVVWDPGGSGAWANLATVEVPQVHPVDQVMIGPPPWARPLTPGTKWTLTAESSAASMKRAVSGEQGLCGRIITGIEYRLAAGYTGRPGTPAPDLRPADRRRKASAGPVVELDWRTCLRLSGDWWDESDPKADEKARDRYRRAVGTLERRGYFVPDGKLHAEAPAGDSVEIVGRVRPARGRAGGLLVRASARFVQAARLAQMPDGKGFETRLLTDWAGL